MEDVREAVQQIQAQREFLLTSVWKPGDPLSRARISFERGEQDLRMGCLIERCDLLIDHAAHRILDERSERISSQLAHRAIFWTLMEMGYDDPACAYTDGVVAINDSQFTQPGEAIEALERTLVNIKEAFGEVNTVE